MATNPRNLIKTTPVALIREKYIQCTARDCRPNTALRVFFDGQDVTDKCIQKTAPDWPQISNFAA